MMNKGFYPTPAKLIDRMVLKIVKLSDLNSILEPSAGKGDIIDRMIKVYGYQSCNFSMIEIDETLQATLRGKKYKVIDSDFLSYCGNDQFDLIIANPPFEDGDLHLLKAIDILYSGQIIFLLNAETIKNPYTNTRKLLVKKLKKLEARVEFISNAFLDAERKTKVEVALINIIIKRKVEDDIFKDCQDKIDESNPKLENKYEVSTKRLIPELVAEYNQVKNIGTTSIISYYANYKKIGKYIALNKNPDKYNEYSPDSDMTSILKEELNVFLVRLRADFWKRTLDIKEVKNRMTSDKIREFYWQIEEYSSMDFTENNIRQFVLNLIKDYHNILINAVLKIFKKFTVEHSYSNGLYDKNIHYFNGWKTNKAFKVGKRIIIPIYASYSDNPFKDFMGKLSLADDAERQLHDIDLVMNYFGGKADYLSLTDAIKYAFSSGQTNKICSEYFTVDCYKKGTIHLTFNSEDILRRFNVVACKGMNWLPHDYSTKHYNQCDKEEKEVIESFEGERFYAENLNKPLFAPYNSLQLGYDNPKEKIKREKL